jgi:hypothetical protein
VPPLPHDVIAGTADQPAAVERTEQRLLVDAVPDAGVPGRQARVADRSERAAAQVQFSVNVVASLQQAKLDVAQVVTRASP